MKIIKAKNPIKPVEKYLLSILIKNSKLSGEDTFTKQNIIVSAGDLTSNDLVDRPGEGVVK